MQEETYCYF